METRICTECGIEKPLNKFGVNGHGRGYRKRCYTCRSQRYIANKIAQANAEVNKQIARNSKGWGYV